MTCPKCNNDNVVLVTTEQKRHVVERRGLIRTIFWIITFPFWGLWKILFGRREKYFKKQHWHCNYCNHDFPQTFDKE